MKGRVCIYQIRFRIYSRNEFRYSFDSLKYLYHGIYSERAPQDATEVIVEDGVEKIKKKAFFHCYSLTKIVIPNTITKISKSAFMYCESLRCIQLPPNLQLIGWNAFNSCSSLAAVYLPPTISEIEYSAFVYCTSLRIVNLPESPHARVESDILARCDNLLTDEMRNSHWGEQHNRLIRNRYNSLHKICWNPSVTTDNIQQCIQQHHDDDARATTKDMP